MEYNVHNIQQFNDVIVKAIEGYEENNDRIITGLQLPITVTYDADGQHGTFRSIALTASNKMNNE